MKERRRRRLAMWVALGLVALAAALWPQPAYAGCGTNISCYVDEGVVTTLRFLAQVGWFFNGNLLLLSRWIEEQRNWLINDVMAAVFDGLLKGASVAWAEAVVIAILVFIIGFSLRSIAALNWVDLRRGLRNGIIALIVFTYGGQLLAASEQGRLILSQAAAGMAKEAMTTADAAQMLTGGGSRAGDLMPPIATVYPGPVCNEAIPARTTAGVMINDIAANYLFATAEDIHCPGETGATDSAPALPRVFWEGGAYPTASMGVSDGVVEFVGFYSRYPGDANDEEDRRRIVSLAMDGAIRQLFGLFLSLAAVIEQVIQTLFSFGTVSLWFSLSIALVFALFVPTEGMLTGIVRTGVELLKQSVLTTIGVTLVGFVVSTAAGSSGVNSGLVAFIGLLALAVLVIILINTGKVIFGAVSHMSEQTMGAAPAAVFGTMAGMSLVAGMALKGNTDAQQAAVGARTEAEDQARRNGANDRDAHETGNRAARAAYSSALNASAVRTFTDVGRAATDAAGFLDDPLRQSMRWQDRAEAERRQKEIIAVMEVRDEERESTPPARPATTSGAGTSSSNSAAQRLRGLPPASSERPYTSTTTALESAGAKGQPDLSPAEREADAEVKALRSDLERAERKLTLAQQQRAAAQGRAAVQKPSALNQREIRRLEEEAEKVNADVARLRQQLDEAERVQRQVHADAGTQRGSEESHRVWSMVQETPGQRDPSTNTLPQTVLRSSLNLAQQQLVEEQQRLDRRPDDAEMDDDRVWLQHQQGAVGSLRRWNDLMNGPDATPAERAAGESAVRTIRDTALREQQAAQTAGNQQRERIAGGVAALADAMLPPSSAAPATGGAAAPAGGPAATPSVAPATGGPVAASGTAPAAGGAATPTGGPAAAPSAAPATGGAGGVAAPAAGPAPASGVVLTSQEAPSTTPEANGGGGAAGESPASTTVASAPGMSVAAAPSTSAVAQRLHEDDGTLTSQAAPSATPAAGGAAAPAGGPAAAPSTAPAAGEVAVPAGGPAAAASSTAPAPATGGAAVPAGGPAAVPAQTGGLPGVGTAPGIATNPTPSAPAIVSSITASRTKIGNNNEAKLDQGGNISPIDAPTSKRHRPRIAGVERERR